MISKSNIILFDGMCNLCNGSIQFILKRDPKQHFVFASLQSEAGKRMINEYGIPENTDTFILIEHGKWYSKSSAALEVCRNLKGLWKLLVVLRLIPRPLRDSIYTIVAKNRYKWFGSRDHCMIPTPENKNRFIE
ncbi:thiol-disulfide oxidoreductase DCC family protein [Aquibacillus sp. 3ASR75-11]|uniref:Thiol-disulfide oxidoreductase DCC family protein n=1 Tax=Terrihalobacillus insolitus TaxID=2950438 RepID=A0A9X4AMX1_9BACI|nr:thiol-disulfide oxidoreductase DCC family protein [Terrihalobacillus insolitus]MDC3414325.1 thiol-disulfide oxidoreductase DCC family protein [Terrihalobacillus insolitus]MDC3425801.1 thiol-disulfide oxidoreductase DCC family protein [Terrihalobacillus insolitus]